MKLSLTVYMMLGITLSVNAAAEKPEPTWIDMDTAAQEVPHFKLIGEYLSRNQSHALQANLLPDGKFLVATYQGGLPGAGWNRRAIVSQVMDPGFWERKRSGMRA